MKIRKLILSREYLPNQTIGVYMVMEGVNTLYTCKCLELPWLDNQKNISCVPEGIYPVEKYNSVKHPNTFLIKEVPDRTGVLIHIGNFATGQKIDTQGCQLPGLAFKDIDWNGTVDVIGSTQAMKDLNFFLPDTFTIIIC